MAWAAAWGAAWVATGRAGTRGALKRQNRSAATQAVTASDIVAGEAGLVDIDMVEAVDYYRTPRGERPGSPNRLRFTSTAAAVGYDAFHLADHLLTQPLQIIIGSRSRDLSPKGHRCSGMTMR